ncbi:MAG TPA: hypothetical protein VG895_04240 [Patescibacteria group bacterium]|nr:hypothetical protein [Patescibacteria group bacterium]
MKYMDSSVPQNPTEQVIPPVSQIGPTDPNPVVTSSSTPGPKSNLKRVVVTMFSLLLMIGALVAGVAVVKNQNNKQLIPQEAAGNCSNICSDAGSCAGRGGSWSAASSSNHPECAPQGGFCNGGNNCGGGGGSGSNWNASGSCINVTSGTVQIQRFSGPNCPTSQNNQGTQTVGTGTYCTTPAAGSCQQIDVVGSGNGVCSCAAAQTPAPTPIPTPVPQCGSTCTTNANCANGMTCSAGVCRNPSCITSATCVCQTPTPTPSTITASCSNIQAYDTNWAPLTIAQLSQLTPGTNVNLAVTGTTTGTLDMARFTINGSLQPSVTSTKPGDASTFYMVYTIPSGVSSFSITAEVHEASLNQWF